MLHTRLKGIFLFLIILPALFLTGIETSDAQGKNRESEREELLRKKKTEELKQKEQKAPDQAHERRRSRFQRPNENSQAENRNARDRRAPGSARDPRENDRSESRKPQETERNRLLDKIRDRRRTDAEQNRKSENRNSKREPDNNIRQLIQKEREKRREARERFRDKLQRRSKEDLRSMRKKREIMRNRLIKRYDKKLRTEQLEQVKNRLERRRERDKHRTRSSIDELRRELSKARRHRFVNRRGKIIDFEARAYRFRKHHYKHLGSRKYRNGLHIYLLPPLGAIIALNAYLVDGAEASLDEIEDVFDSPMAVRDDETYDINEIIEDPEIRRKVRSVNLDSITFASGSSEINEEQLETLDKVAQAIQNVLERKPNQVFLIEGHTDATGEEEFNQSLSEDRAAAVKDALISQYGIPEQNLVDVGYGEEFLKVDTQGDEEENRRVAIRNISPLLAEDIRSSKK